ncbi:MAG: chain-length determining protein, partial [Mesorhizobium sp.]
QTAKAREDQLVADVNTLKAASARAGEQQVQLDALQRDANVQRQQLESYMASYNAAASRKDRKYSPVAASLIAQAQVPSQPYFPKIGPITGAAAAASLLLMAIGTLLGELFSGRAMRPAPGARFESIEQVAMPVARTEPAIDDQRRAFAPYEEAAAGHSIAEAELPRPAESEPVEVHAPAAGSADSVVGPSQPGKSALEPRQSRLGEIDVDKAAEKLIASGAARAIFVSPEGDEAAASAVLVAREVSDAGLRVLLLDLTASGAASRPMLDSSLFPGITNLLASEAQFSDVIHPDLYSDAHVIPVGTADPVRAMRAADRLPIIMQSLTTAYDLVVVECGPADAQGISRLVGDGTEVFLSMLEADDQVTQAAVKLIENGYPDVTLVTPVGHEPGDPLPGRRSAA